MHGWLDFSKVKLTFSEILRHDKHPAGSLSYAVDQLPPCVYNSVTSQQFCIEGKKVEMVASYFQCYPAVESVVFIIC